VSQTASRSSPLSAVAWTPLIFDRSGGGFLQFDASRETRSFEMSSQFRRLLLSMQLVQKIAAPRRRLAQAAERKQVESCNLCGRRARRRQKPAHNLVRAGVGQEPAVAADLGPQRADRIADAAAERELGQR